MQLITALVVSTLALNGHALVWFVWSGNDCNGTSSSRGQISNVTTTACVQQSAESQSAMFVSTNDADVSCDVVHYKDSACTEFAKHVVRNSCLVFGGRGESYGVTCV